MGEGMGLKADAIRDWIVGGVLISKKATDTCY